MGSILCIGDLHLANFRAYGGPLVRGINRRCQELLDALRRTVDDAIERHDIQAVLQVGDFFDNSRPPAPIVDAALDLMTSYKGLEWHLLAGNHDVTAFGAPSALAPLSHVPGIFVHEIVKLVQIAGYQVCVVPYVSHSAEEAVQLAIGPSMSLVQPDFYALHYGVVENANRPDLITPKRLNRLTRPSHRFRVHTISGHEHGERIHSERNVRVGSFAQINWSGVYELVPPFSFVIGVNPQHTGVGKVPRFRNVELKTYKEILSLCVNWLGNGLYLQGNEQQESLLQELDQAGLIQGWRLAPKDGESFEEGSGSEVLEEDSAGHEETVTAALEESGADLMEEGTQRIWEACVDHLNKSNGDKNG